MTKVSPYRAASPVEYVAIPASEQTCDVASDGAQTTLGGYCNQQGSNGAMVLPASSKHSSPSSCSHCATVAAYCGTLCEMQSC